MRKKCLFLLVIFAITMFFEATNDKSYVVISNAKTFSDPSTTYMTRIDINFDADKVRLSPAYTYRETMRLFENGWTAPEGAHYDSGGNVWFRYCPEGGQCEYDDVEGFINSTEDYNMNVLGDRYHWIDFEVQTSNCQGEGTVCAYDFDENNLDKIDVYINGVKNTDAFVKGYNVYWHLVNVYVPMSTYTGPLVKSIKVTSPSSYVQRGTTSTFTANVDSYGAGSDGITWTVTGNISSNTKVNSSGVLTVDNDEEAEYVVVRATSTFDNTIYDQKTVSLIDEPLSIDRVIFTRASDVVVYGGSAYYTATADGTGNSDVLLSISGANSVGTTIDEDGLLTVAADETATSITITATSVFDNTKKATKTVTLRATEIIDKIELYYDTEAIVFSTKTTYGTLSRVVENNWHTKEDTGYDEGNNNAWFAVCSTSERCVNNFVNFTSSNYLMDTYTYLWVEVFAKPSENNGTNPLYDYDKDHLDQIEIWVNGVKRDDAFAYDYNDSWRMVKVYIPVTITDGKLAQYFEFDYDTYEVYYGPETTANHIRIYNGGVIDGTITYTSSDPDMATVNNGGNITLKKIGTCTITATASETEDYKEYSRSYTLVIEPMPISPNITIPEDDYHYIGSQIIPDVTVTYFDTPLVKDVDYTITYGDNLDSGYGWVYISPAEGSNYTFNERSQWFWIYVTTVLYDDITINPATVTYNGTAKEPSVSVVVEGRTLIKDTDYTVEYTNNVSPGTAYAVVRAKGNYSGVHSVPFEIVEAEKGDMNKNGKIDLNDIIVLLRKYLNGDIEEEDIDIGDMNDDENITLSDVIALLRLYLVG